VTLSCPGFSPKDISVVLHKPENALEIKGDSKTFGKFTKLFKNLPEGIELKHLAASVAHGVLRIRMADPNQIEEREIAVRNVPVSQEDPKKCILIRRSVPGVSAAGVSCMLTADRRVRVEVSTPHMRTSISTSIPRDITDFSTISASCVDGILCILADRDEAARKTRVIQVQVSGEQPAALNRAETLQEPRAASLLPTADTPTNDKPTPVAEDFDGKIEDLPM